MDLYFEAYSGIAGDMTIGALLDLGADKEVLIEALKSMNFGEYKLIFERCKKKGIEAFQFDVITEENSHEHHHHHYMNTNTAMEKERDIIMSMDIATNINMRVRGVVVAMSIFMNMNIIMFTEV